LVNHQYHNKTTKSIDSKQATHCTIMTTWRRVSLGLLLALQLLVASRSGANAFVPPSAFVSKKHAVLLTSTTSRTTDSASTGTSTSKATSPLFYANDTLSASDQLSTKSLEDYVKERGGDRVIKRVLIASNGMGATKAIISMRQWAYMELGDETAIQFVAMATPEDIRANAEFVRLADSYVQVPGGKNLFNYANVTVISQVAQEQGVDAVWPGWGHASENPKLPEALNKLGIKFIGPTSPVMSVLGDKIAANILAQTAGLPSV